VERCDRAIQLLGHGAHGGGTDRPAEHRQQGSRDLAGREPEHEAGEDHAIDVLGAPDVGLDHLERAEAPGARHVELDHAELNEQPARVTAVAPVGPAELGHALEVLVDQLAHPAFQQLGERVAGTGAIILTPFHAFGLHGLHHRKGNR
jgi:hypothetical protein